MVHLVTTKFLFDTTQQELVTGQGKHIKKQTGVENVRDVQSCWSTESTVEERKRYTDRIR